MIRLYLIRHAIAHDRDPARWRDDRQRPLTPEGVEKFRRTAAGLGHLVGTVDRLLTSPLVRARETAGVLHDVAGWPAPIEHAALAPGRTVAQVLALLREQLADSIALVGHEPWLGRLLAVCVAGPQARLACHFKKGGAACLSFRAQPRPGQATLEWLATPKLLRALAKS
ncbi:MAG TPA: phosphohistidine phosphatase SixA [Steroidobacteraceae bacterium]|nr:phosphohistidine phosphatase SixA [Steroidobacteraceae bacterium]